MTGNMTDCVDWGYFRKFDGINDDYLPDSGEGEDMATQIVTAVNKLIYKWYNDGDVFDNQHTCLGWANDLSSYANWLYTYVPESKKILLKVFEAYTEESYSLLLKELADTLLDDDLLEEYAHSNFVDETTPRTQGTIYECDGPFAFDEESTDEYEDWNNDEDPFHDYTDDANEDGEYDD